MARCTATTRMGDPCKHHALKNSDSGMCANHAEDSPTRCTTYRRNGPGEGTRCGHMVVPGTTLCRLHGGKLPNVERAGKRRIMQARAAKLLENLGEDVAPITDPIAKLQKIAGRMDALQELLWAELHPADGCRPNPFAVEVYLDCAERVSKQLGELKKLGLDEVRVQIEGTQAVMIAEAMQRVMRDLDLSPEQRGRAPWLMRRHLLGMEDQSVTIQRQR